MTQPAIVTEALARSFGAVRAVDGLSLAVPAGTIFGFLGPNGAGKTTTIRLLLGLLEPTSGRAEVLGLDTRTHAADIRAQTGVLLEHSGIYEQLSVENNLDFYGRVWHLPLAERQARIQELLQQVGLWDRRADPAGKLSRGMQQKLALARALLHRPPLVLLDEPTAGLDVMAATAIREDLARLAAAEGVTIFLTTHNMAEAEKLCQQVAVIRAGRLVAQGQPDDLRARQGRPCVEVVGSGFSPEALALLRARPEVSAVAVHNGRMQIELHGPTDSAPLVSLLVGAGVQVEEVRRGQASLEDVFVTLMEEGR